MKKDYPNVSANDGDFRYCKASLPITCCDCGLRHFLTIDKVLKNGKLDTNKQLLAIRFYRDQSMTEHNREIKKWKKH